MTNDQDRGQLTEDRKGAVVHCCDLCARAEGWDFSRPLEELEKGMGVRAETIFADQADEWAARGYEIIQMSPCALTDSGLRLTCPHLQWGELVEALEMRRKFLAEGIE